MASQPVKKHPWYFAWSFLLIKCSFPESLKVIGAISKKLSNLDFHDFDIDFKVRAFEILVS